MECYIIGFSSIIGSISWIIITIIREKGKKDRIKEFNEMDSSKIESIGNYENKSKAKYYYLLFWKKKDYD